MNEYNIIMDLLICIVIFYNIFDLKKQIKELQLDEIKRIAQEEKEKNNELIKRKVKIHIVFGLLTDGGHHKQFQLEEIANLLKIDLSDVNYEKGIPN